MAYKDPRRGSIFPSEYERIRGGRMASMGIGLSPVASSASSGSDYEDDDAELLKRMEGVYYRGGVNWEAYHDNANDRETG